MSGLLKCGGSENFEKGNIYEAGVCFCYLDHLEHVRDGGFSENIWVLVCDEFAKALISRKSS